MEVKGIAVKSIFEYVKKTQPSEFKEWIENLPKQSKELYNSGIYSNKWYNVDEAAIEPTKQIAKMFFGGDVKKGAWDSGRYSAEVGLKGIYKLYVKFSTPKHIIARANRVFSAYYQPCELEMKIAQPKFLEMHLESKEKVDPIIGDRIAGWMQKALEISGCKQVKITVKGPKSIIDKVTVINCAWD